MFGSLKLGKVFGIELKVHNTFWLLLLLVLFDGTRTGDLASAVLDVGVVMALFVCVALHEGGHALAAARYGVRTRDITLHFLGGVARMERIPEKPAQEIVIALAGPAVNLVIALLMLGGIVIADIPLPGSVLSAGPDPFGEFVWRLMILNVFLAVFNLLPAFPMDGGRVLRALLATGMPRLQATSAAVGVGTVLAIAFVGCGITGVNLPPVVIPPWSIGLILLGLLVLVLGRVELAQVRMIAAHREWEREAAAFDGPYDLDPEPELLPPPPRRSAGFTGWKWDPIRRVWTQWLDGTLVREVHLA